MRRAKSRNFILVVCGVLLALLMSFCLSRVLLMTIANHEDEDNFLTNVIFSSTKVAINGDGNFLDSTPVVDGLTISKFNVRLSKLGDRVRYLIKYCNMNDQDLIYKGLSSSNVSCKDSSGRENNCEDIIIRGYVLRGNKELEINDRISASSCVNVVIDAEYDGIMVNETNILVDEYTLKLGRVKKIILRYYFLVF